MPKVKHNELKMDRRAILMLGLSGASSLVLGKANGVLAQTMKE